MSRYLLGASLCLWFGLGLNAHSEDVVTQPYEPSHPPAEPVVTCEDQIIQFAPYSGVFDFKNVSEVTLNVYCVGNTYGRMVLNYEIEGVLTTKELTVTESFLASCGHRHYFGHYASSAEDGYRFSVRLTDLDSENCYDMPFRWMAEVRTGFGWCGTGDSVMTLIEKPYEYPWQG